MADSKITALTALTAADPTVDMFPVVDVSDTTMAASGTTKRISINNILACSPSATLASATITGALTIGGATSFPASVINTSGGNPVFTPTAATLFLYSGSSFLSIRNQANTQEIFNLTPAGVYTFGDGAGGTRMTLNATGLGVGGSPTRKLSIVGSGATYANINSGDNTSLVGLLLGGTSAPSAGQVIYDNTANSLSFFTSGASRLLIDSSGNVGIGVTPSAWSGGRAVDLQLYGNLNTWDDGTAAQIQAGFNFYQTGSTFKYKISSRASMYRQRLGVHSWHYDTGTQTANADCTFTQAMTLDASGNLLVGSGISGARLSVRDAAGNDSYIGLGANNDIYLSTGTSGVHYFRKGAASAAMTLDASGRLYINDTAQNYGSAYQVIKYSGTSIYGASYKNGVSGNGTAVIFANSSNALAGYIDTTNTTVTYASVSDYRLKEQVQPISGGLDRVNALKPSVYKWKTDGSDGEGFLAHELASVVPLAVTGEKDAVNEDGSIKPQGVDLSKVVPVLVAAIQELTARVQTLETR